ncbi:MAG: CDP-diacylglycerol--serine O-phosphatidyltransferase [Prevotellaceae bacterium]|jgi:CDP-diacylglycerol--serine O-phosphatidyltransferase|nr:CDP-diacylglycerol--serine O-phosphatidyltransferase [Prevotellaceae bacterium]
MKKYIPNLLTICNLLCGSVAVLSAYNADYTVTVILVLAAAVFDFLDGFAARLLKAYSPIGKELDSLADMISFGLAPAVVACTLLKASGLQEFAYVGLLIAAFSALRLAKFNIDERQTSSFIGLPTPANAIFWVGLAYPYNQSIGNCQCVTIGLTGLILLSCFLLVCNLPMYSLKFKSFNAKENFWQILLVAHSIMFLILLQVRALPTIILFYVVTSIIKMAGDKRKFSHNKK